jgi:hypothetical protein
VLSINELEQNRAKEKALYMVSLVQDTSSLEEQGLDNEQFLFSKKLRFFKRINCFQLPSYLNNPHTITSFPCVSLSIY